MSIIETLKAHQPFRAAWISFRIASLLLHQAWLSLVFLPKGLRPNTAWSWKTAIRVYFLKDVFDLVTALELPTPGSLEPSVEGDRFTVISPASPTSKSLHQGLLDDPQIRPTRIGGTWYPFAFEPSRDRSKKVILHFHPGAYVATDGRDQSTKTPATTLCEATDSVLFSVQYRLAGNGNRFPAALQDAVQAYSHVLSLGFSAEKVVLSGSSAGGNVVMALLRYLAEYPDLLPQPKAAVLSSPWADLSASGENRSIAERERFYDTHRNAATDMIRGSILIWGIRSFVPDAMPASHPYISPLRHPFQTRVPMLVISGSAEVIVDELSEFVDAFGKVEGNVVDIYQAPNVCHELSFSGQWLGFEEEHAKCVEVVKAFLMRCES